MGAERREHIRHDVSLRVQFRDLGALQDEEVKNLSRGGALVVARQMRPLGAKVPVTLVHPVNGSTLDILAEVKRVQAMPNGSWALGVQFVGFDQALKLRIHDFVDSITGLPAAPAPSAGDKLNEYLGIAAREESSGSWKETLRYLDLALAVAPDRADVHGWKARIAEKVQDWRTATIHAQRAVELDPKNELYAKMAKEIAARVPAPVGGPSAASAQNVAVPADVAAAAASGALGPAPRKVSRRSFLPTGKTQWALAGVATAAVLGLAGYNVWYFFLRNLGRGPRSIDPGPYREIIPLKSLKVDGNRAFGVVEPGWTGDNRAQKVAALALKLQSMGVTDVFLTNDQARIVATWRNGAAKVY